MVAWLVQILRGVAMGVADIIPGVSGGTLALILGIYERFIEALSHVGWGMLRAVFTRAFWAALVAGVRAPSALPGGVFEPGLAAGTAGEAGGGGVGASQAERYAADVLFLGFLVVGIGGAFVVGARIVPSLLDHYPAQMKAFFLGLVLASVAIPVRHMRTRGPAQWAAAALTAVGTFLLVGAPVDQSANARGEVTVTLATPAAEPVALTREGTLFLTARLAGADGHGEVNEKREIAFGPARDLTIPAGAREITVPVVARMRGAVANLAPGQLRVLHGGPAGATVTQPQATAGGRDPALWFVAVAGFVAISAMVLPGISGSFILLLLGLYHYMTFTLRALVYDHDPGAVVTVAVFLAALAAGIMLFSRFLRWLLARAHDTTMAALVGLMLGSLRKLWPFTSADADGTISNVLPQGLDARVATALGLALLGVVIVLVLERLGRAQAQRG